MNKKVNSSKVRRILKEWDPSMSTDPSAPFNQSDWEGLRNILMNMACHENRQYTWENLPSPSDSELEKWAEAVDPDGAIWEKHEEKIEVPGQSFKSDDIDAFEMEVAPVIYKQFYKPYIQQKEIEWKSFKKDKYKDLYEGFSDYDMEERLPENGKKKYGLNNFLDDMQTHQFIDADPGDKLLLKNKKIVWVVNYEGASSWVVTDDREMLQSYGKALPYQIKKRNPSRSEDFHGQHSFDENEYYTWVVREDEISYTIKERDVIVEGKRTTKAIKNKSMKMLKESIENYIPNEIKELKHPSFKKMLVNLDHPLHKTFEDFFEIVSEQDWADEFTTWANTHGLQIDYNAASGDYVVRNVGGRMNESKKIMIQEVGRGLNMDQVISEIFTEEEKVVIELIEKSYKDFTILKSHYNVDYITLNLVKELDEEVGKDLEAQRFVIAKEMAQFRQDLISDLSEKLPVVNIKAGPYQFIKGSDKLIFNVTILLSDTGTREWVSGQMTKGTKKVDKK